MGYDMYRRGAEDSSGDGSYFRLNIWGMGTAREELLSVGVVRVTDDPDWPLLSEYGLRHEPDDEADPAELTQAERGYLKAIDQVRDGVPPGDHAGIAIYKFGSNDGWLVTPGEITTSIAWADHHHSGWRDELTDYVREFVDWMTSCVPYGGFEVH